MGEAVVHHERGPPGCGVSRRCVAVYRASDRSDCKCDTGSTTDPGLSACRATIPGVGM